MKTPYKRVLFDMMRYNAIPHTSLVLTAAMIETFVVEGEEMMGLDMPAPNGANTARHCDNIAFP